MLSEQGDPTQLNRRLAMIVMALSVVVLLTGGATAFLWAQRHLQWPRHLWSRPPSAGAAVARQVVFAAGSFDNLDLYLADPTGNKRQRLTDTPESELYPAWSPDGQRLAFMRVILDNSGPRRSWGANEGVFWLRFDGDKPVEEPLVLATEGGIGAPTWSPDGKHLAFITPIDYTTPDLLESNLVLIDTTTKERTTTRIPVGCYGATAGQISWSPDGKMLALLGLFQSQEGEQPKAVVQVYLLDSQEFRIVAHDASAVAWSPTEPVLACLSRGQEGGLQLIQPDGVELRTLFPNEYARAFAWSPDGTTLAIGRMESEQSGELVFYRLADDSTTVIPMEGGGFPTNMAWSADGSYLSYSILSQGVSDIELTFTVGIVDVRNGTLLPFAPQELIECMASLRPVSVE